MPKDLSNGVDPIKNDVIIEFTRQGELINHWSILELLQSKNTLKEIKARSNHPTDWFHSNAIFYDETHDAFIVSVRHQDWVIQFDRTTGKLAWRLGAGGEFDLIGEGEWQRHQHGVKLLDEQTIVIYDNGNGRFDDPSQLYTRAVAYQFDTAKKTSKQVWEFRDDKLFYSPFLGEMNVLKNGNFLVSDGGKVSNPSMKPPNPENQKSVRILEITYDESPEKVFELIIKDDSVGYSSNRTERIVSLYDFE